jgi:thiol-disulfide isomerase/thioredoxin
LNRFAVAAALFTSLLAAASLASCADPELERRVAELDKRVSDLEANRGKAGPSTPGPRPSQNPEAPAASQADEEAAGELFRAANEAAEANNYDLAKAKLQELSTKYGNTRTAQRSQRLKSELAIVGTPAGDIQVDKWYTSNKSDFDDGKATMVVFWETWCPHCQDEVPKLEDTWSSYKGKGLNIIALTKVTRSSTDEKVDQFIDQHHLTFPVAKETSVGAMS